MPGDSPFSLVQFKVSQCQFKKSLKKGTKMKFLVVAFALICVVSARPQFGFPGQFGGSSSNAAAGAQTFK